MLYVQIGIGKVTMPALVDSGARSNFIDQDGRFEVTTPVLESARQNTVSQWPPDGVRLVCGYPSTVGISPVSVASPRRLFVHGYHLGHSFSASF